MGPERKLFARKMFRLRVYEAKGTAFQGLFEKVMQYRFSDFTPIKPYGNIGDRKNDGYIPSKGRYFQVYAPENPRDPKAIATAANKAAEDFSGLLEHWNKSTTIVEYRFVYNDEFRGSPPPLEDALAKIRKDHRVKAKVFLAKDLEDEAFLLAEDQLMDVIQTPIPSAGTLPSVDFSVLRDVINHVLEQKLPLTKDVVGKAPDFDEKIRFNGLSRSVASLLTVASYQIEAVTDYFSMNSTFARQQLRDHLNSMYENSRDRFTERAIEENEASDLVFFDLLGTITPPLRDATNQQKSSVQEAALVVMAYYFEACDIFEDPDAATG